MDDSSDASDFFGTKFDADELTITSNMTAVATRLPFGVDTALVAPASTTTTLRVTKLKKRDSLLDADVEWWVYAASSAGALVVLALFTVVLWKVRRPTLPGRHVFNVLLSLRSADSSHAAGRKTSSSNRTPSTRTAPSGSKPSSRVKIVRHYEAIFVTNQVDCVISCANKTRKSINDE